MRKSIHLALRCPTVAVPVSPLSPLLAPVAASGNPEALREARESADDDDLHTPERPGTVAGHPRAILLKIARVTGQIIQVRLSAGAFPVPRQRSHLPVPSQIAQTTARLGLNPLLLTIR